MLKQVIELIQYTGKATADNKHTVHQSGAPSMENDAKEKLVIKNDGKFDQEEAKGIEDPTKSQIPNTKKESMFSKFTIFVLESQFHFVLENIIWLPFQKFIAFSNILKQNNFC